MTVTGDVTEGLTDEEIQDFTDYVEEAYGVQDGDVTSDVDYVATGSLTLDVPDWATEEDVANAVQNSIAEELGVHPSVVTIVSVDLESGEVVYEVEADTYDEADTLQTSLEDMNLDSLENSINNYIPGSEIVSSDVEDDIEVEITFTVDASEGTNGVKQGGDNVTDYFQSQNLTVQQPIPVSIITSAPSVSPSFTTVVPTRSPSVTGIVVSLTLSAKNEVLNETEIADLQQDIADEYGVNVDDVDVDVTYTVSGELQLNEVPQGVSEEELEAIIEQELADSLGLHPKDVEVDVNMETGEVSYTVTVDDSKVASNAQDTLQDEDQFLDTFNQELAEVLPGTTAISNTADDDILMQVDITVDATDSSVDVSTVTDNLVQEYTEEGFDVVADSNNFLFFFTFFWLSVICHSKTKY